MDNNNINNDSIDLKGTIKSYLKHWKLFGISIFACGVIAFAYIKLVPPTFEILANILIKQENSGGGSGMQAVLARSFGGNISGGNVDDEIYVVQSHSNMTNTVKKLELNKSYTVKKNLFVSEDRYIDFPVDIYAPESLLDTLSTTLKFYVEVDKKGQIEVEVKDKKGTIAERVADKFPIVIDTDYGIYTVIKTDYFEEGKTLDTRIFVSGYSPVAESLSKEVEVVIPSKRTNVICLSIEDKNIFRGKDFLNTLIDLYNKVGLEQKNLESENTALFIEERIKIVLKELSETELIIQEFKKKDQVLYLGSDAAIAYAKKESYKEKQLENELKENIGSLIVDFINDPENKGSLLITSSKALGADTDNSISSYNNLVIAKRELLISAKEDNPAVIALNRKIDIAWENIKDVLATSQKEKEISFSDIKRLEKEATIDVIEAPAKEKEYADVLRQKAIQEELLTFLLQKREENSITLAANTPKGLIVDEAYNRNIPVSLPKKIVLLMGLMFGFFAVAAYLFLKGLFNTKFESKEELEKITAIPVLGEVCKSEGDSNLVIKDGDNSSVSELFRLIRTNLQFLLGNKNDKVILVTSSISGEGKSFVSSNLAASLALTGKRVLLVGLDIRQPKLAEYLNVAQSKGVTNYLSNASLTPDDIVAKEPFAKNLDVILSGPVPPNPSELLLSDRLELLITTLKDKYDYIVIDSAPVGMVSDTYLITPLTDITLYVCRANYTQKENIKYAENLVIDKKLKRVSLIINGTTTQTGYGYGYGNKKK